MHDGPALTDRLTAVVDALRGPVDPDLTDAGRVDLISVMEDAKAALCAAQAKLSGALDASQRHQQAVAGTPPARRGQGVAAQIGLARRESHHTGGRLLALSRALADELPHTLRALERGRLNEWRAWIIVRETACLSREDRARVDEELGADAGKLDGAGDRAVAATVRQIAARLDAAAMARRAAQAEADRRVTLRPAPDTMAYLTVLLPVAQAVSAYAALSRTADTARAAGDPRTRGQLMADTLYERLTGRAADEPVPAEIRLVMTDRSLLQGDSAPARLAGYGIIPAQTGRDLARRAVSKEQAWVRRLFTHPDSGELLAVDSRSRSAPGGLAELVATRDNTCRTPWCDAPIRHTDHVVEHALGGPTSLDNLQGLCQACNHAKQAPGWESEPTPGIRHTVIVHTPTGHSYRSTAPPLPGHEPSRAELHYDAYRIDFDRTG